MEIILNLLMKEYDYTKHEVSGDFIKCPKCDRVGKLEFLTFPESTAYITHKEESRLIVTEEGGASIEIKVRDKCDFSEIEAKRLRREHRNG